MAGCIVEHKEGLGPPICLLLEDIDRILDLQVEFLGTEVSLAIFASFE